jgi:phage shock protein A
MAKHTQSAEMPASDLPDLDQRIAEITHQVKERFSELKHEAQSIQRELERLSEQHQRLTGRALLAPADGDGAERGGRAARRPGRRSRRRTRKPSPTVEWLQDTLARRGMTVKQIKEAAAAAGYSGLRIAAMLRENKGKFKSEPGKKEGKQKGVPAAVWGVKS